MKTCVLLFFIFSFTTTYSQTLGGNSVFNFLKLPNTPQLSSLGGINISQPSDDIGLVFNNPALLKPAMHSQLNAVFNSFYSGIKIYHLSLGYHHEKLKTNFSWGLHYFDYGSITQTDAAGNILGSFRPVDWVMQVSVSRPYMEKWNYGATLKFIHSGYGQYRSSGIALDVGLLYEDTSHFFSASVVARNMGFQIKKYEGADPDELPFDLQAGLTKRLANAPFSFSFTAHHLHQYNIRYNDRDFDTENGFETNSGGLDKLFRHFILATTVFVGEKIEFTAGYNYLRRKELNIGQATNGLNGFSLGLGVKLDKLQIRYARVYYQNNSAYNQFGLNMKLNKYFGLGKWGKKIGW